VPAARLRRRAAPAAALAAGVAAAAGQAPLGLWPLTLAGLALLCALVARAGGPRRAAGLAWLGGTGHFAAAMSWIVEPFLVDAARHGWMAPFALVLMSGGLALFWGAAGAVAGALRGPMARVLGFAAALALAELARGYLLTGLPWAAPGHVWIDTPLAQLAVLAGASGLTALTLLAAALPVAARGPRAGAAAVALAAAVLGAGWLWGAARLDTPSADRGDAPLIRIVQPNAAQHLKWRPDMARLFFQRQIDLTAASGPTRPDLVIWPETAVPFLLNHPGEGLARIAAAAGGAPVALGIQRTEGFRAYNSLAVIDAAGAPLAVYDKFHLVPFGEYIPFGDMLAQVGITAFAAREGNGYSPGPGAAILDLGPGLGTVQPLICYEAVFPQDLRAAPARPDWLLQVTNDGWFGTLTGPYQHFAQARLRAIEQGLPLLRAANTGISAVVDARGRVVEALPLGAIGRIDAALPPAGPPTPYARAGDLPLAALLAAALLAIASICRCLPIDAGRGGT